MQKEEYLIKEAARAVKVESHVLRYWEEELDMPIQRNEKGHRIYTQDDLERFMKVKELKEEGLQLKAVKKILQEEENPNFSFKIKNINDFVKINTPEKVSQILKNSQDNEVDSGNEDNDIDIIGNRNVSGNKDENTLTNSIMKDQSDKEECKYSDEYIKDTISGKTVDNVEKKYMKYNDNNIIENQENDFENIGEIKDTKNTKKKGLGQNEIRFIPRMKTDNKVSIKDKRNLKEKHKEKMKTEIAEQQAVEMEYQSQQEKIVRMQSLIKKFITDTVVETHNQVKETIKQEIREDIAKEIDYQFRCHSEIEEENEKNRREREDLRMKALQEQGEKWEIDRKKREEAHYKNIDELLRKSLKNKKSFLSKGDYKTE